MPASWYFTSGGTTSASREWSNAQSEEGSYSAAVVITTSSSNYWEIQLGQGSFDLDDGVTYRISAWAYGDAGTKVRVDLQQDVAPSYTSLGNSGVITLAGTGWEEISFDVTADAEADLLTFSFGYPENANKTIYIDNVVIDLAPEPDPSLMVDFESDTAGTSPYGTTGWDTSVSISQVVTLASVTGLPANGDSVNVLKVSPPNYNTVPKFEFTLPEGHTLADYVVKVDAYFPRDTLGLTEEGDNYYKSFLLLAGAPMTGAAVDEGETPNPLHHYTYSTDWSDVDAWETFTLTPDATKGASLTGTIEVAIGLSRPAVSGGDDYYFDNVRLELVE